MFRLNFILLFVLISFLLSAQELYINEFMADNDTTIADPQGDFDDWVEIYNAEDFTVDLAEMHFGDDHQEAHQIPSGYPETIIPANGFIIVWFDKDEDDGPLHIPEKLGASGDEIYLWDSDGTTVIDSFVFGPQTTDISEGRTWDGAPNWSFFTEPTPGSTNGSQSTIPQLFINEFLASNDSAYPDPNGEYDDWIEIYNAGTEAVDIGGMYITDDLNSLTEWQIPTTAPDSTTIQPDDFLILWADKDSEQGVLHCEIKLSGSGEQIGLIQSDEITIIDSLTFGPQTADISYGRYPDGSDNWELMPDFTPGAANISSNAPPFISDVSQDIWNPTYTDNVNVTAYITDDSGLNFTFIKYDAGSGWQSAQMYDDGAHGDGAANDDVYGGYIPNLPSGTNVTYYVEAIDNYFVSTTFPADIDELTYQYVVNYPVPAIFINEFMADNEITITDPEDDYEDWIEIYNAGATAVDIGGMYISDDIYDLSKWWQIPATNPAETTIQSGESIMLWADKDTQDGVLHVDLKLSNSGEEIGLFGFYGSTVIDSLSFEEQYSDVSYGRFPDGAESWEFMFTPTPESENISGVEIDLTISVTDSVHLSWSEVIGANSYLIYRATEPEPINWGLPLTIVSQRAYTDEADETKYFYRVKASTEDPR